MDNQNKKTILNFNGLGEYEQKEIIIDYVQYFTKRERKSIRLRDLETKHITQYDINRLFGSLGELRALAGAPSNQRKQNMSDEELKVYIQSLVQKSGSCPSYQKPGTICFRECSCWVTDKVYKNKGGRPQLKFRGKSQFLSRVVYTIFIKPIEKGKFVLHICDNLACFNPKHLMQGTAKDNAEQCIERGRRRPIGGGKHKPHHKITDPHDFDAILTWVKANSSISERGEWLYPISIGAGGYPRICIKNINYILTRLILANKLNIPYKQIVMAGHKFPENLPYSGEAPQRNDVNPDHLYDTTAKENADDAKEYHQGHSLSRGEVTSIFEEAINNNFLTTRVMDFDTYMAKKLNVSSNTVRKVRTGKTYKNWHSNISITGNNRVIVQLSMQGEFIAKHNSRNMAAKATQTSSTGISKVCKNKLKSSGGYVWMYEPQYEEQLVTSGNSKLADIQCVEKHLTDVWED